MKKICLLIPLSFTFLFACKPQVNKEPAMPHKPISPDRVVMYELFIRNFTPEGTINAIIPKLNDLKDLGINTIWLMPIQPTGKLKHKGTYGSPYSISDYYAINPDFGTKEDFRKLVDSIHAKGMNVIIDMVANHTAWDNNWITKHPDWYTHDSITHQIVSPVPDWTDAADLNYDNKDLRSEMTGVLKYWVDSFDVDGYRCDVAEMVPLDFWKNAIGELNKSKPVIMLAEGADPKLIDAGFQITYGWELYHDLKKLWKGEKTVLSVDTILENEKKYTANARRLRFITNHDETSWDNSPVVLFGGIAGSEAAYVVMATMPGVPLIYNGQEFGSNKKANLFEKTTIDWSANPDVSAFYKNILTLYNNSTILQKGSVEMIHSGENGLLAYYRKMENEKILIMVNATDKEIKLTLPDGLNKDRLKVLLSDNKNLSTIPDVLNSYGYFVFKVD